MKDPIIIRQRLTNIDWEIDQLTTERSTLEAELARVGLKAAPYPYGFPQVVEYPSNSSKSPKEATLEEILQGNWHFCLPTPEARRIFRSKGVPLEEDRSYWTEDYFEYVVWHDNKAYTTDDPRPEDAKRELRILNGELYFA